MQILYPYRWQLGLLPFFVVSIWLAFSLDVAKNKGEFVTIAVLYVMADILMVNSFVAENRRIRAYSQLGASITFTCVFFFTYWAYSEVQYALAQPLFWVAAWKIIAEESDQRLYPYFLGEKELSLYTFIASLAAIYAYAVWGLIPTQINLLQFFGVALFGLSLAVRKEGTSRGAYLWGVIGAFGLSLFTLMCLGDVAYKYSVVGHVIATPLVAFFAAFPVAIVMVRNVMRSR